MGKNKGYITTGYGKKYLPKNTKITTTTAEENVLSHKYNCFRLPKADKDELIRTIHEAEVIS